MQLAYPDNSEVAFQGMLADAPNEPDVLSRCLEAGEVPFGVAVKQGANEGQAALLAAVSDSVLGVTLHQHIDPQDVTGADAGRKAGEDLGVVQKGRIWVLVEEAVTPYSSPVWVRHTANGGTDQPGAFRISDDGGNALELTSGVQWVAYKAIAGLEHGAVGLAQLDINLPA
jgi:hypothetical protein